jgi:hypothetical protein
MGKSMYDYGNQGKEKARQQKQMDKVAKRNMAKQQKAPPATAPSTTAAPDKDRG